MKDVYLELLMRGEISNKLISKLKDPLEIAIDQQIDQYLATFPYDENINNSFYTLQSYQAKLKAEMINSLEFSPLLNYLDLAFFTLSEEGLKYLDAEKGAKMKGELAKFTSSINRLSLESSNNLKELFQIEQTTINEIFQIGIQKFQEDNYLEALSVFILLTLLVPEDWDLWYRAGIASHSLGKIDLSIKFYEISLSLNDQYPGILIFLVESYLNNDELNKALETFEKLQNMEIEEKWKGLFNKIKSILEDHKLI